MKKLTSAVFILFILTVLVSGASARPEKITTQFTVSVSENVNTYATPSSADGNSYTTSTTYAAAGVFEKKKGFAIGASQAYIDGGAGSKGDNDQTISGTLS